MLFEARKWYIAKGWLMRELSVMNTTAAICDVDGD